MLTLILITLLTAIVCSWCLLKYYREGVYFVLQCPQLKTIDGSDLEDHFKISNKDYFFRNSFDLLNLNPEKLFNFGREKCGEHQGYSFVMHFFGNVALNVTRAEDFEDIAKNQNLITKGKYYEFMHDFLGTGLLTSTGSKWQLRRKLLTPTFHFNILEEFMEILKQESKKLAKYLSEYNGSNVSLTKTIPKYTLNMICETALGVKLDEMSLADDYRNNIKKIEEDQVVRTSNIHLYYEWIYSLLGYKKTHLMSCDRVHEFTEGIVNKRRAASSNLGNKETPADWTKKKRYAMLDTLLSAETNGEIDHAGICEEVDTLTFEGYDTTSTGILFTLFMLANHQDVQQKCYEEILNEMENVADLSIFALSKLKYLDCVIKESLRLYPPVPYISRKCTQDSVVGKVILPKGTEVSIHIFDIHRDARHFPNPERFDPNRFLPENTVSRHPFAYVPFSAGSRNCIGQKFAMLELKTLIITVLKEFRILPVTKVQDLVFISGLILRSRDEVLVKFVRR